MEELDLSGLEDDIENIEEIAYKDSYTYVTQIYIYVRIDGDYVSIFNHFYGCLYVHLVYIFDVYIFMGCLFHPYYFYCYYYCHIYKPSFQSIYKSHSNLMKLGEKYMTLLQNAMLNVQLKKNGIGEFICYYQKKDITENLATYFLIQKEIDYIQIGFEKRFPEGRISPIVDAEKRKTSSENIKDEL